MNFLTYQNEIKEYIKENLPIVLAEAELSDFDNYIDDYLDLDEYQQSKQLFFDFGQYTFEALTNQTEEEVLTFNVCIVFQNDNKKTSRENMLKYTAAFYEMFDRSGRNFGGIADIGNIATVDFYNAAEGNEDVKISVLTITLIKEI